MSAISLESTVGSLVAERPSRARVLERWSIDYCCGGKKPLSVVCQEKGLDSDALVRDLLLNDAKADSEEGWADYTMETLADHIVSTHHAYLREELPRLSRMAQRLVEAHGSRHPELLEVQSVFEDLREELEMHMYKEEQILFPLCRALQLSDALPLSHCGSVNNPIRVMEHEHDSAGRALERLRTLTGGYTPPTDACNTYRVFLASLAEFEADMHLHIHKENNILFPKAIERERELAQRQ